MNVSIEDHKVLMDGKEFQMLSGAIHYFRTCPEQWEDRLLKLKNCGFNTVETYVPWHLHELHEGDFDVSGRLDIVRFIRTAQKLGLMVIVRPGPYICSECDLGGMPGWLLGKPGIRLRCSNVLFMRYVKRFFDRLLPLIAPLQCTQGGPIIAMQIENEYGSYGNDRRYLRFLTDTIHANGIDIQLFTSDGAGESWLKTGTLPDYPASVNYRCKPIPNMQALAANDTGYANAPLTMELWVGKAWHWGKQPLHHRGEDVAQDIRDILVNRYSANCYMFHGGTNFGFTSGANYFDNTYCPLLTSYEVDAILDEAGNTTEKYLAVQRVMEELRPGSTAPAHNTPATAYQDVKLTHVVPWDKALPHLAKPQSLPLPEPMEAFGQTFGFIQYTTLVNPWNSGDYEPENLRDRAIVLLDGKPIATLYRNDPTQRVTIKVTHPDTRLDILVENMGRICFDTKMESEHKGITGFHRVGNYQQLNNWTAYPLPLEDWSMLPFQPLTAPLDTPAFYRGTMTIEDTPQDTFLSFPHGTRGYVQVNGFNVGRYWTIGPQRTLYIPAPLLRQGDNDIAVFELHGLNDNTLHFTDHRDIGPMEDMVL